MNPSPVPKDDPATIAAAALNEQGYLFHHKIIETFDLPDADGTHPHNWYLDAVEVPVSLANQETRIDIVLRHGPTRRSAWRAILECKRASRDYKRWIFFDQKDWLNVGLNSSFFVERVDLAGTWHHPNPPPLIHRVETQRADDNCPIFNFWVEARLNRPGSGQRISSTDGIEDAFQQVMLGQAGLATRLKMTHEIKFRLVPVVVTTAELVSAHYDINRVSLDKGAILPADIRLESRNWLAVNYRISDVIAQNANITVSRSKDLQVDLSSRQIRTVFVVAAPHIQGFLTWLGQIFPCATELSD